MDAKLHIIFAVPVPHTSACDGGSMVHACVSHRLSGLGTHEATDVRSHHIRRGGVLRPIGLTAGLSCIRNYAFVTVRLGAP
jgi:hypothetical protein